MLLFFASHIKLLQFLGLVGRLRETYFSIISEKNKNVENLEKLNSKFLLKKCVKGLIFLILNFSMFDFLGKNGVLRKKKYMNWRCGFEYVNKNMWVL